MKSECPVGQILVRLFSLFLDASLNCVVFWPLGWCLQVERKDERSKGGGMRKGGRKRNMGERGSTTVIRPALWTLLKSN